MKEEIAKEIEELTKKKEEEALLKEKFLKEKEKLAKLKEKETKEKEEIIKQIIEENKQKELEILKKEEIAQLQHVSATFVKVETDKIRVLINYTDLNKGTAKVDFPLPLGPIKDINSPFFIDSDKSSITVKSTSPTL